MTKLDRKQPPSSLQTLVDEGCLRAIPVDPITQKAHWTVEFDQMELFPGHKVVGIYLCPFQCEAESH